MQAIPSVTPLSRTAFWTSSVMSVRVRPPAVRRRVSCWNTFIVEAILRESLRDSAVEPPHPQWILRDAVVVQLDPQRAPAEVDVAPPELDRFLAQQLARTRRGADR